jgi:exopolyphosphatase/guanosine-5'-triphosphate,3'-diphosphate pyrophosphatase
MDDLISIIDIGSNSIRLSIYDQSKTADRNGHTRTSPLLSKKIMAGLAAYIENGIMSDEGIDVAIWALTNLHAISVRLGIKEERIFATASLRDIHNSANALAQLRQATNLPISLLSKQEEALLAYEGIKNIISSDCGIVADIGGGSTEIVLFERDFALDALSLSIGSLGLFKRHVSGILPTSKERKRIQEHVRNEIERSAAANWPETKTMYCIGGSARAMGKLLRKRTCDDRSYFAQSEIDSIVDYVCSDKKASRDLILKTCPDRIHTIVPGELIIQELARFFNIQAIAVADTSIREGLLYTHS